MLPQSPNGTFWHELKALVKGLGADERENSQLLTYVENMETATEQGSVKFKTRIAYRLAINRFLKFMRTGPMARLQAWPPTKHTLALYMRYIELAKNSFASLRQIYFAVNWRLKCEGLTPITDPIISHIIKTAALTLVKRVHRKHGMTPVQLKQYLNACAQMAEAGHLEYEAVGAIGAMQYMGIARINEILEADREDLNFETHPTMGIVGLDLEYQGKCDTVREGHTKYIEKLISNKYCAVHKTFELLKKSNRLLLETGDKAWKEPLFQWHHKRITYGFLIKRMKVIFKKIGLNPTLFGSHSFRAGATTAALARGCPLWMVKRQGGWRSEAINGYFIPNITMLTRPSASMGMGRTVFHNTE